MTVVQKFFLHNKIRNEMNLAWNIFIIKFIMLLFFLYISMEWVCVWPVCQKPKWPLETHRYENYYYYEVSYPESFILFFFFWVNLHHRHVNFLRATVIIIKKKSVKPTRKCFFLIIFSFWFYHVCSGCVFLRRKHVQEIKLFKFDMYEFFEMRNTVLTI